MSDFCDFSFVWNLESVLGEHDEGVHSRRRETGMCVCLCLSSNIINLLYWVFVSEDVSCLYAVVRLHVLFIIIFYMTYIYHIDV